MGHGAKYILIPVDGIWCFFRTFETLKGWIPWRNWAALLYRRLFQRQLVQTSRSQLLPHKMLPLKLPIHVNSSFWSNHVCLKKPCCYVRWYKITWLGYIQRLDECLSCTCNSPVSFKKCKKLQKRTSPGGLWESQSDRKIAIMHPLKLGKIPNTRFYLGHAFPCIWGIQEATTGCIFSAGVGRWEGCNLF